jgi:hypothetical protein
LAGKGKVWVLKKGAKMVDKYFRFYEAKIKAGLIYFYICLGIILLYQLFG